MGNHDPIQTERKQTMSNGWKKVALSATALVILLALSLFAPFGTKQEKVNTPDTASATVGTESTWPELPSDANPGERIDYVQEVVMAVFGLLPLWGWVLVLLIVWYLSRLNATRRVATTLRKHWILVATILTIAIVTLLAWVFVNTSANAIEPGSLNWLVPYLFWLPATYVWSHFLTKTTELGRKNMKTAVTNTIFVFTILLMFDLREHIVALIQALGLGWRSAAADLFPDTKDPGFWMLAVGFLAGLIFALAGHTIRAGSVVTLFVLFWLLVQA